MLPVKRTFKPGLWLESGLLGLMVIPGAIMISVLLACILMVAITALLILSVVQGMRLRRANHSNRVAGP
jgi:hypothetical protein